MEKFKFVKDEIELEKEDQAREEKKQEALKAIDEKEETEVTEIVEEPTEEVDIEGFRVKKRPYFGFKTRVFFFFIVALLFFVGGCYFLVESVDKSKSDKVTYDEVSSTAYQVCMKNASHYQDTCQKEGRAYISEVANTIESTFKYNVKHLHK